MASEHRLAVPVWKSQQRSFVLIFILQWGLILRFLIHVLSAGLI